MIVTASEDPNHPAPDPDFATNEPYPWPNQVSVTLQQDMPRAKAGENVPGIEYHRSRS